MEKMDLAALEGEVAEFDRLCLGVPECDATGKLRCKLGRLRSSLADVASGDLKRLDDDVRTTEQLVRRFHEGQPLTQLLQKLAALRVMLQQDSSAGG